MYLWSATVNLLQCVDFEILQHLNLSKFQYTDFFLAWNLKMTLLDSVSVLRCCSFILCVTRKINISLATTFKRFYNSQII